MAALTTLNITITDIVSGFINSTKIVFVTLLLHWTQSSWNITILILTKQFTYPLWTYCLLLFYDLCV